MVMIGISPRSGAGRTAARADELCIRTAFEFRYPHQSIIFDLLVATKTNFELGVVRTNISGMDARNMQRTALRRVVEIEVLDDL